MWKSLFQRAEETKPEEDKESTVQSIKELGQMTLPDFQSDIHVINIIGQIEGHVIMAPQNKTTRYEHVLPQLVGAEQSDDIKGVLFILNTVGGDDDAAPHSPHRPRHRRAAEL